MNTINTFDGTNELTSGSRELAPKESETSLTGPIVPAELTQADQLILRFCQTQVARALTTCLELGEALLIIRDHRLYRQTHDNFDAYCRETWPVLQSYAHRRSAAAEVIANLLVRLGTPPPPE